MATKAATGVKDKMEGQRSSAEGTEEMRQRDDMKDYTDWQLPLSSSGAWRSSREITVFQTTVTNYLREHGGFGEWTLWHYTSLRYDTSQTPTFLGFTPKFHIFSNSELAILNPALYQSPVMILYWISV